MTLRLYARRKDWPLDRVRVTVGHKKAKGLPADLFVREIGLTGTISDEQTKRLLEIAERCPVHRTLASGAGMQTALEDAQPLADIDRPTQHVLDTQESIEAAEQSKTRSTSPIRPRAHSLPWK
jgi:putative redox protein